MSKISARTKLLDAGLKTMLFKGYHNASVRDIVQEAQTAQGSFTNYFSSKEQFANEVLDQYFEHIQTLMAQALGDTTLTPRARLLRYLDIISDQLAQDNYYRGCLIGDLSAEMPAQNEVLRLHLDNLYSEWRTQFVTCIAEAQDTGEITTDFNAEDLAEFLLASWEGAILRTKVARSPLPLERFKKIAFTTIFK